MLPVSWLVVAVLAAVLLTTWITFTLTRLDRLHARVDAAQAAMDAQLVRRAAALQRVAETADGLAPGTRSRWAAAAQAALGAGSADATRADAENAVTLCSQDVVEVAAAHPGRLRHDTVAELQEGAARVRIARRFYNDAVRDTRSLRARRLPRLFRMAGRRAMPDFFDIDDTLPSTPLRPAPTPAPAPAGVGKASPAPPAPTDDRDEDQP